MESSLPCFIYPKKLLPDSFSRSSFDLTDISHEMNSGAQLGWYPQLFLFCRRLRSGHIAQFHYCIIQREPISLSNSPTPSPVISSPHTESSKLNRSQRGGNIVYSKGRKLQMMREKWLGMLCKEDTFCLDVNTHTHYTDKVGRDWVGQRYSSNQIAIVFCPWDIETLVSGQ